MTSYLLLRNNKETGPHTFEELLALTLKPYDLVWVSGKSAAWRYPGEIEELRPYAPEVVEQPFDRFYKKNTSVSIDASPVEPLRQPVVQDQTPVIPAINREAMAYQPAAAVPQQPSPVPQHAAPVAQIADPLPAARVPQPVAVTEESKYAPKQFTDYEQQYIPKKSVYVTLPGRRSETMERKAVPASPLPSPEPVVRQPFVPEAESEVAPATIRIRENPETAKIKYSQPLDEIKEMYVKTLQDRKSKIARQAFMKVNLKRVAIVAGLIGFGVLTGYIIRKGDSKAETKQLAQNTVVPVVDQTQEQPVEQPGQTPSANTGSVAIPPVSTPSFQAQLLRGNELPAASMNEPVRKITKPVPSPVEEANRSVVREEQVQQQKQQPYTPAEKNVATGERIRSVRTAIPDEQQDVSESRIVKPEVKSSKSKLGTQVYVTTNDYKRVAFGGIRNLELTVTNNSKYDLDNVLVELQYLKPSEEAFRIENVRFRNIAPNEAATIRIPDTNRGIKVRYRIVSIGSKQLNEELANN